MERRETTTVGQRGGGYALCRQDKQGRRNMYVRESGLGEGRIAD